MYSYINATTSRATAGKLRKFGALSAFSHPAATSQSYNRSFHGSYTTSVMQPF